MYTLHISAFTNISELQIIPSLLLQSKIPLLCQFLDYLKKLRPRLLPCPCQAEAISHLLSTHALCLLSTTRIVFLHFCTVTMKYAVYQWEMSTEIDFWKKIYGRCILCSSREQMEAMVRQYCVCFPASCSTIYINKGLTTHQYSFLLLHYKS